MKFGLGRGMSSDDLPIRSASIFLTLLAWMSLVLALVP